MIEQFWMGIGAGIVVFGITSLVAGGVVNHFKLRWMGKKIGQIHDATSLLVTMHQHPDDYKFGTEDTNKTLEKILKAIEKSTEATLKLVAEIRAERLGRQK